jgi:hypothetical protein
MNVAIFNFKLVINNANNYVDIKQNEVHFVLDVVSNDTFGCGVK